MNRQILKLFLSVGGLIIAIAGALSFAIYHWQNPDMTSLRLFLSNLIPTFLCVFGWSMIIMSISIK